MRLSHWSKLFAPQPLVALLVAVLFGLAASAQVAAQWPPEVKNLKFFPEDKDVGELLQTMRGFAFGLGVQQRGGNRGSGKGPCFEPGKHQSQAAD